MQGPTSSSSTQPSAPAPANPGMSMASAQPQRQRDDTKKMQGTGSTQKTPETTKPSGTAPIFWVSVMYIVDVEIFVRLLFSRILRVKTKTQK